MGSTSGGIFAQTGIPVLFFARSIEKAEKGKRNAIKQARSGVLGNYIESRTYDDLEKELPNCDWIFEGLVEDISIKKEFFDRIDKYRKKGSIISTVSSELSIEEMASGQSEDFKSHFMGTHFYYPPSTLIANELIFHPQNSEDLKKFVANFCSKTLHRKNIITMNVPAFAGNRIGFQFLNYASQVAEEIGVEKTDYLLGAYTGRYLPPLAAIDLIGLDVHKAIVDNVYHKTKDEMHNTYKMPAYMEDMIQNNMLGIKTPDQGGFFKRTSDKEKLVLDISDKKYKPVQKVRVDFVETIKQYIHDGNYRQAIDILKTSQETEAKMIRKFILGYISYSFHRMGEVTPHEEGIHGIDRVMAYGFSWLPPSGWVDLLGGPNQTLNLIEKSEMAIPKTLKDIKVSPICKISNITKFLIAR